MNLGIKANGFSSKYRSFLTRAFIFAGILFCAVGARAQTPESDPTNIALQSWSFSDPTYWTDDAGYSPISVTNIASSQLGYGQTLVVDTNIPAWLKYNVVESDRTTNLTIQQGTVTFWFAPGSWSSTNAGGVGPSEYGRLLEVGNYTANSSYGLWSIYVDSGGNNLYFSAQTNDLSSNLTTYVCAPISWTTNDFHFIALTYSATNTTLYLDGVQATNGPGVTVFPGENVLTNGFCIGSDTNGIYQAHGLFDLVQTYNYPLDSNDVQTIFAWYHWDFIIDPNNAEYMDSGATDPFSLSTTTNLAISPLTFSNNMASLFVVNSTADVTYEVQGCTNLAQRNWFSEGFVLGSELTNWTWANFYVSKQGDLFLRIRNWQDSTGTGIPDWWWLQYFGQDTNVNQYADPTGDGWTLLQDFENGWNPNVVRSPPAPQLTVSYNYFSNLAALSWVAALSPATSYTVERFEDYYSFVQSNIFNLSGNTNSFQDSLPNANTYIAAWGQSWAPTVGAYYQIQAHYAVGDSAWSAPVYVQPNMQASASLVAGPQGSAYLAVASVPSGTTALRLWRLDLTAELSHNDFSQDISTDILLSSSTNGFYLLPTLITSSPLDVYGTNTYQWNLQLVNSAGATNASEYLADSYYSSAGNFGIVPPYIDGRVQLKQNLTFLLRAGLPDGPFQFWWPNNAVGSLELFTNPPNYAYSGFIATPTVYDYNASFFDVLVPFENNYLYRNFVYSLSDLDSNGRMTTGISDIGPYENGGADTGGELTIDASPTYQFQSSMIGGTNVSAVLGTNETQWLASYPLDGDGIELGISLSYDNNNNLLLTLTNDVTNVFGLPILEVNLVWGNMTGDSVPLTAGSTIENNLVEYVYPNIAQPQFQTLEYDFWSGSAVLPGNSVFSPTNTSQLIIAPVGVETQVFGYAKLAVQNGNSGVCSYLGQYFDKAYQTDTNGNATTNITGILSPYGEFFATQSGPTALKTMPDPDTGQRGTDIVYAVSLNVDKNHDGTMDLTWNGPDTTSQSSPMNFWINNGDDGTGIGHAIETTNFPDSANGVILSMRDLENFARLWICGMPSIELNSASGYQATLSWNNVSSGNPAIKLFLSQDPSGSDSYLTDTNAAQEYVGNYLNASSFGTVTNGASFTFPDLFFESAGTKHFIFEGVSAGQGELVLTITDSNNNIVAQTGVWLNLQDVEDLYEQAHIQGVASSWPAMVDSTNATTFVSDYELPANPAEANQMIVFVHGWRMGVFDYESFSDTMFKRLYWEGYQGRFAALRWPTLSKDDYNVFPEVVSDIFAKATYNRSEYIAHRCADGTSAYFDWLKSRFPNYSINVAAHSMGNIVMMDTLKLQLANDSHDIDNYVMMQAAVPAQCYDTILPNYSLFTVAEATSHTPDIYRGYPGNIAAAVSGQIVDYFNTNDFALVTGTLLGYNVSWEGNEVTFKPDSFWGYTSDGTNGYRGSFETGLVTDSREQMAFVARPRSKAAGALAGVASQVDGGDVDLTAQFNFENNYSEHSAEFNNTIQQLGATNGFYRQLEINLGVLPPVTP